MGSSLDSIILVLAIMYLDDKTESYSPRDRKKNI